MNTIQKQRKLHVYLNFDKKKHQEVIIELLPSTRITKVGRNMFHEYYIYEDCVD